MPLFMLSKYGSEKTTFISGETRRNLATIERGDISLYMLTYLFYVSHYTVTINSKIHLFGGDKMAEKFVEAIITSIQD